MHRLSLSAIRLHGLIHSPTHSLAPSLPHTHSFFSDCDHGICRDFYAASISAQGNCQFSAYPCDSEADADGVSTVIIKLRVSLCECVWLKECVHVTEALKCVWILGNTTDCRADIDNVCVWRELVYDDEGGEAEYAGGESGREGKCRESVAGRVCGFKSKRTLNQNGPNQNGLHQNGPSTKTAPTKMASTKMAPTKIASTITAPSQNGLFPKWPLS